MAVTRGETMVALGRAARSRRVPSRVTAAVASLLAAAESVRADDLEVVLRFTRSVAYGRGHADDVIAAVRVAITIAKLDVLGES